MPFNSIKMKQISIEKNLTINTSSSYYTKSNGIAEKSVGVAKKI